MNPDQFDSELKTYYRKIKTEIKTQHQEYISKHPELREILNDFLSQTLLEKPKDVYSYATEYFSYFNIDKDKIKFHPLVICGPPGIGKGTLMQKLIQAFPQQFEKSISYTTRAPLPNETHGVEYFFVSQNEFEREMKKDSFIEYYKNENGKYFGTHSGKLNAIINSGKVCLMELNIQGSMTIQEKHPDWKFLFLAPSSQQVCQERMKGKNIYSEQEIQQNMRSGSQEIQKRQKCDFFYEIINDDIDKTFEEFVTYIKANYTNLEI